ncbi:MAG: InlB B-repeat-containing protein, partial [Clostridia bacterium]|nr:InlB B-repeat-containing protein [Clostridia bacterium]
MKTEETIVNLIFEPGKGNVSPITREATSGERLGNLPIPVRPGYRFEGWYRDGTQVTPDTVVSEESDVRLVARWTKIKKEEHRVSLLRKQKRAILILAAVAVFLIATFVVVAQLIAIYSFEDVYRIDGVQYSDKYIVKRQDGIYKMFDEQGNLMETNGISENVFVARGSGNHYRIDPDTGKWELRAAVDSGDGEYVSAINRLLLYPTIQSSYVYSINVTHRDGHTYTFYHTPEKVYIDGFEDSLMEYDPDLYSKLCFGCGSTYAGKKLVLKDAAKLENGKVDYSAYGLDDPQASFTITGILFKKDANGKDLYNGADPVIDYVTTTEDGKSVKNF